MYVITLGPDVLVELSVDTDIGGAHALGGDLLDLGQTPLSALLELHLVHELVHVDSAVLSAGLELLRCLGHFWSFLCLKKTLRLY